MKIKTKIVAYVAYRNGANYAKRVMNVSTMHKALLNLTKNDLFYYYRKCNDVVDENGNVIEEDDGQMINDPHRIVWINAEITPDRRIKFNDDYPNSFIANHRNDATTEV